MKASWIIGILIISMVFSVIGIWFVSIPLQVVAIVGLCKNKYTKPKYQEQEKKTNE